MRTTINIVLILLAAVMVGLGIRTMKSAADHGESSEPIEVFSNSVSPTDFVEDDSDSVNAIPSHPPEDEAWLSRFELIERSGEKVSSEELLGQPYVVSFFYSTCPSICIRQNQKLKELQDEFEGQGVRFVAISVDPETDTPEQLREYAARFGADEKQWLFMTGDLTYIRRIGAEIYRLPVDKQFHSERFVLVDSKGEIEGFYSWPEKPQFEKLKQTIREMIEFSSQEDS
ncbi:SCO family protein [Novipirellula artificiosorum]|uniref:Thioredoxin domain-containing protein n=1 Tax=Novipirellula artificiosorum TaxID=2528016 RepID=A0A5C6E0A0_9BACT|nr:SCO family protein [Novipirellula artificiosorum]TWU42145.1 hypothetical protein Poly41_04410 [Novipirellula artificiosorum]